jgi:long-subunit fatty acid transport protein
LVELTMPLVIRSGVAVRPIENLEVEFATVYERWRTTKETTISNVRVPLLLSDFVQGLAPDLGHEVPIKGPVVIPQEFRDSISFRLGGEWEAKDWLSLRSGMYWERSAINNKNMGVSLMDGNKVGYGLGASYHVDDILSFDIGFSQAFLGTRKIRDSELKQLKVPIDLTPALMGNGEAIDTSIGKGAVVSNGDISSTLTMVSFGATYYFGKPTKRTH